MKKRFKLVEEKALKGHYTLFYYDGISKLPWGILSISTDNVITLFSSISCTGLPMDNEGFIKIEKFGEK